MKKNRLRPQGLLLLPVLLAWACSSAETYKKIQIEIPSPKPVPVESFQKLLVADFWVVASIPDFDLNQELRGYTCAELGRQFKIPAVLITTPFEAEPDFSAPAAWLRPGTEGKDALLLTGKAQLTQETRKALSEEAMKDLDGPFAPEKKIIERRVATLDLSLVLLKAETGDVLFRKDYKETMSFENIKQPASFAFFELIQRIKVKFLRAALGEGRVQERYLISD